MNRIRYVLMAVDGMLNVQMVVDGMLCMLEPLNSMRYIYSSGGGGHANGLLVVLEFVLSMLYVSQGM